VVNESSQAGAHDRIGDQGRAVEQGAPCRTPDQERARRGKVGFCRGSPLSVVSDSFPGFRSPRQSTIASRFMLIPFGAAFSIRNDAGPDLCL
jgi:hypothetical protein